MDFFRKNFLRGPVEASGTRDTSKATNKYFIVLILVVQYVQRSRWSNINHVIPHVIASDFNVLYAYTYFVNEYTSRAYVYEVLDPSSNAS